MRKFVLTITLNPALDCFVEKQQGRENRSQPSFVRTWTAGGKGVNVSRALKVLQANPLATGFSGGWSGEYLKDLMDKEKIVHDFIDIQGTTRVNLTLMDKNRVYRSIQPGPQVKREEIEKFAKLFNQSLKNASMVILSGSRSPGIPDRAGKEIIQLARKKDIPVIVDTSGPFLRACLSAKPFLIKPNLEEAQAVLKKNIRTIPELKKAIVDFHHFGAYHVIISLGSKGAIGSDWDNIWTARPPRLQQGHHVGCGDALVAGFVYGYHRDLSFQESLRYAVAAGSASVLSRVPGGLRLRDFKRYLSEIKLSKI